MREEKQIRILYAEDDVQMAELYRELLVQEGFEVDVVHDGIAASEKFKTSSPHIVLLDIMMPGKSGYELIEEIRKKDTVIPVVIFSSMSDAESVTRALDMGADEFIRKEYSPGEVKARIKVIARKIEGSKIFKLSAQTTFRQSGYVLSVGDKSMKLTFMEAKLLRVLCEQLNAVIDKGDLCEQLWALDTPEKRRALDSYLVKLRKYLKADPAVEIKTHYGEGITLLSE